MSKKRYLSAEELKRYLLTADMKEQKTVFLACSLDRKKRLKSYIRGGKPRSMPDCCRDCRAAYPCITTLHMQLCNEFIRREFGL